jgi:hypothetical protein
MDKPIRISMDSNDYSRSSVYSRLFFQYKRMKRLIDNLEGYGYLQKKVGFNGDIARETRIWATAELVGVFADKYKIKAVGDIHSIRKKDEDLIQLRREYRVYNEKAKRWDKKSEDVPFNPTDATRLMQTNVKKMNATARHNKITVHLGEDDLVNLEELTEKILLDLMKGKITLLKTEFVEEPVLLDRDGVNQDHSINTASSSVTSAHPGTSDSAMLDMEVLQYQSYSYPVALYRSMINTQMNKTLFYPSITHNLQSQQYQGLQPNRALLFHLLWVRKLLSLMKPSVRKDKLIQEERPLNDFGIKALEFEIKSKDLHRVFNRASFDFDQGGRFYGPYYQGMPSKFRKSIRINGNETVEYDYSGLHIRMLYHQLGLEFTEDPYTVGDGSLRDEYKLVSLISINAKRQGAHIAIRDALEDAGLMQPGDKDVIQKVVDMMDEFKARHEPIKEFLFSGVGIELQNRDSKIMEDVLLELDQQGIYGMPIHDSVIVEKRHAELLWDLMLKKYQEHMNGFNPVLKVA